MNLITSLCAETNNAIEIITVIAEACVSVISVLLGFCLSKLTEKTTWTRRKSEQIREHQITSMTNFLHQAKRCLLMEKQIFQLQDDYHEKKKNVSALVLATLMDNTNNTIKAYCDDIAVIRIEIEKYTIELEFLQFSKNKLESIIAFMDLLNNIFNIVTQTNRYCENTFDAQLLTEAADLLDNISNTALQGLSNK